MGTPRIQKYIVYGLKDPLSNQIRYVGKSSNYLYRPKEHLKERSWYGPLKDTYLYRWVRKLVAKGHYPEIVILETAAPEVLADRERYWIKNMRDNGVTLCNLTDGGEGCLGRKVSEVTKGRISKAHAGRKLCEEHRRALSLAKIGRPSNKSGTKLSQKSIEIIRSRARKKKVICVETKEVWESAAELCRELKYSKSVLLKHLNRSSRRYRKPYENVRGLHYEYLEVL